MEEFSLLLRSIKIGRNLIQALSVLDTFLCRSLVNYSRIIDLMLSFMGPFQPCLRAIKEKTVALIKRIAVTLHLIPKTMKGKEFLKRIFFGKLLVSP